MSEQPMADGHTCPECSNQIIDTLDHHADCPVSTNWWQIEYGGELICFLCDAWLVEGDFYRWLPQYDHPDDDDILESAIGRRDTIVLKPVCMPCAGLRLVHSVPVAPGATRTRKDAQIGF